MSATGTKQSRALTRRSDILELRARELELMKFMVEYAQRNKGELRRLALECAKLCSSIADKYKKQL